MNKPSNERRKYLRIYRNFILTYYEIGKISPIQSVSQVNNVSKGGLNFSSTYPIKKGAVLMIDLKTPFLAESIPLEGVVLECKEKVPEMIYEIRLQFQEITDGSLAVLEKIESYSKDHEDK